MKQYLDNLQYILDNGEETDDRTGVGTLSVFGLQTRYDLSKGFPAVTTKKLAFKTMVAELLWFLEGSTDERRLAELTYSKPRSELVGKQTIWTANADAQGVQLGYPNTDMVKELGPVYGAQWRSFGYDFGKDQIEWAINQVKTNPNSRRIIVSAWDANNIDAMTLPPCHTMFQLYVNKGKLSCQLYQRSADMFLGVPFNIASYALLTHLIAKECELDMGDFIHVLGDAHIYKNHINQVNEQLSRTPMNLPTLGILDSFDLMEGLLCDFPLNSVTENFRLFDYEPMSSIPAPMAV